jgi:hypothetical protein
MYILFLKQISLHSKHLSKCSESADFHGLHMYGT